MFLLNVSVSIQITYLSVVQQFLMSILSAEDCMNWGSLLLSSVLADWRLYKVPEGSSSPGGRVMLEVNVGLVPPRSTRLLILSLRWTVVTLLLTWQYARSVNQRRAIRGQGKLKLHQGHLWGSGQTSCLDMSCSKPHFLTGSYEWQSRWEVAYDPLGSNSEFLGCAVSWTEAKERESGCREPTAVECPHSAPRGVPVRGGACCSAPSWA